ncbi:MAG: tRNA uridine-5-carboxymethylaminomethyl(34) synthesis GTPase MnmE [Ignavibacteriales bacterium]|nr:tRNA uridine-5-carboxymethylaminomethyl(34) synthesis GTPase MnmE [Ignavibacteriales bacterium]
MNILDDTIVAIATPLGEGGLSVIRLSGRHSLEIADICFRGKGNLSSAKTQTAHFGYFVDDGGNVIDEVVATLFLAPKSYTTENIVEFSCHGGAFVTKKILQALIATGARLAEPGEFTKRAFLNGRIDLSQAEAVSDLIHSRSELAHQSSVSQIKGELSSILKKIREKLLDLCGLLELELDFVEEGYQFANRNRLEQELSVTISEIEELLNSFSVGRFYREGIRIVITGKPNVGKSSLLNALLQENRSIVTDIPGTTRDVIEDELTIDGITFRFIDTAGIRETKDEIEAEGVRRSYEQIEQADVIIELIDVTDSSNESYSELIEFNKNKLLVFNKIDLVDKVKIEKIKPNIENENSIFISAKHKIGIKELEQRILSKTIIRKSDSSDSITITNVRHKNSMEKALNNLQNAHSTLTKNQTSELLTIDIRSALNNIGEITGEVTSEEILNNIFSKFCIGK